MECLKEVLNTKISHKCDVLIAGGGFAGISAALAAAREGARVLLCEKEFALGGLATLGLVTIYLPLCDGCGNQMSFGIAEELFKLSIKYGAQDRYPSAWLEGGSKEEKSKKRYMVQYNPHVFEALVEQLLIDEGVEILYGTSICSLRSENGKIRYVILENKTGRSAVEVKSVVDATGDADICVMSGEDTKLNPRKNPLAAWYYRSGKNGIELIQHGPCDIPVSNIGEDVDELKPLTASKFDGVTAEELTTIMVESRKCSLQHILENRKNDETAESVTLPTIPQLRMTRRLVGKCELSMECAEKYFEDSIGVIGSWRKSDVRVEIPFRTLYGGKVKNLITAGRCISSEGDMWDLTRVIPCCAVTGQAAGTAAAISDDFMSIDVKKLQEKLEKAEVKLHIKDCI